MKKVLIFALSLMMLVVFAVGCSSDKKDDTAATATEAAATEAAATEAAAPEAAATDAPVDDAAATDAPTEG